MTKFEKLAQSLMTELKLSFAFASEYSKICINYLARKLGKPEPCTISKVWRKRGPKPIVDKHGRLLHRKFVALPQTVQAASIALVLLLLFLLAFGEPFDWGGVTTELWGLIAEIFILGVIIFYIGEKNQAAQFEARQHELISDFRYWNSEEAKFRILGAIRRLQRVGVSSVHLSGLTLSSAKLKEHGIGKLDDSILSGGHWATTIGVRTTSTFEKVDFSDCSLRNVVFSSNDGLGFLGGHERQEPQAIYIDCNFMHCDLLGASFQQAELRCIQEHPSVNCEIFDEDEYGQPVYTQVHFGEFHSSELADVSFKDAWLENVDFRGSFGLEKADFSGARGLESCLFDDDYIKQIVLENSKVTL